MEDDDAAPDPLAETLRVKVLQEQVEALRMELADAKAEVSPTFFSLLVTLRCFVSGEAFSALSPDT